MNKKELKEMLDSFNRKQNVVEFYIEEEDGEYNLLCEGCTRQGEEQRFGEWACNVEEKANARGEDFWLCYLNGLTNYHSFDGAVFRAKSKYSVFDLDEDTVNEIYQDVKSFFNAFDKAIDKLIEERKKDIPQR